MAENNPVPPFPYDKKSFLAGLVTGQGLKGRARVPLVLSGNEEDEEQPPKEPESGAIPPAPVGFPQELWEEAYTRAEEKIRAIQTGAAQYHYDERSFLFGIAAGRSLEGWELDAQIKHTQDADVFGEWGLVMYYVHADEGKTFYMSFDRDYQYNDNQAYFDFGDGYFETPNSYIFQKEGDYVFGALLYHMKLPSSVGNRNMIRAAYINGVEASSYGPFEGYSNNTYILESATLAGRITKIAQSAFYHCFNLTSVTIPNSVTSIGSLAFYGCSALADITIPESVTSIGGSAFTACSRLTNITIPNLNQLGDDAFHGCTSLTDAEIGGNLSVIPQYAFYGCSNLLRVTIPDSVNRIEMSAFEDCGKLLEITIPDSVTVIGDDAFCDCENLTNVTLPSALTEIGNQAFAVCRNISSVTIPDGVTSIGYYAFSATSITDLEIPGSVTAVYGDAFQGCKSLINVVIRDGVQKIGTFNGDAGHGWYSGNPNNAPFVSGVFENCTRLTSVTIPASVKYMLRWTFYNCPQLRHIYYAGTQSQWNSIKTAYDGTRPYGVYVGNATVHYNSTGP